jgi:hypothetical protein
MRLWVRLFSVAAVLAASTFAARADTFSYDFSFAPFGDAFTYNSPVLIDSYSTFTPTTCIRSGASPCTSVDFDPVLGRIQINSLQGDSQFSLLPPSFFTVGTHTDQGRVLTITDNPSAVTPEPSSFLLLSTGLLGIVCTLRRRLS